MTTIITKKTGAGHFDVIVMQDHEEIGTFQTTEMPLIDDIQEMNEDGFQNLLIMHDTFDEVIDTCMQKLKK